MNPKVNFVKPAPIELQLGTRRQGNRLPEEMNAALQALDREPDMCHFRNALKVVDEGVDRCDRAPSLTALAARLPQVPAREAWTGVWERGLTLKAGQELVLIAMAEAVVVYADGFQEGLDPWKNWMLAAMQDLVIATRPLYKVWEHTNSALLLACGKLLDALVEGDDPERGELLQDLHGLIQALGDPPLEMKVVKALAGER